jgi:hypothetical protein
MLGIPQERRLYRIAVSLREIGGNFYIPAHDYLSSQGKGVCINTFPTLKSEKSNHISEFFFSNRWLHKKPGFLSLLSALALHSIDFFHQAQ